MPQPSPSPQKRLVVVGTGSRCRTFLDSVAGRFRDNVKLVGLCDTNPARIAYHNRRLVEEHGHPEVAAFAAGEFQAMLRETRADTVLVTTVDATHHTYILQALAAGCDCITEKPMTTGAEESDAIHRAVVASGRSVRVTFNCRWSPAATLVRRLLASGAIGEVQHVQMEYMLNTRHGADYFRRWHRSKAASGGLLVHKSTHHFDLVNWWLDAIPETVFGFGKLAFYGRENGKRHGFRTEGERTTGIATGDDPFALKLDADPRLKALYFDAEAHDGYLRDRNVFGSGIDIEDSMSVLVRYRTGAVLTYSLNAFLPREGMHVVFNGTGGRLEYRELGAAHLVSTNPEEAADAPEKEFSCTLHPLFGKPQQIEVPRAEGGHNGADPLIHEQLFSATPPPEKEGRSAGHEQGAASLLVGVAANHCFETGLPVALSSLSGTLGARTRLHELV